MWLSLTRSSVSAGHLPSSLPSRVAPCSSKAQDPMLSVTSELHCPRAGASASIPASATLLWQMVSFWRVERREPAMPSEIKEASWHFQFIQLRSRCVIRWLFAKPLARMPTPLPRMTVEGMLNHLRASSFVIVSTSAETQLLSTRLSPRFSLVKRLQRFSAAIHPLWQCSGQSDTSEPEPQPETLRERSAVSAPRRSASTSTQ
mmetsp:Transcript_53011/g.125186  ORF Transcript_53011/g.125186 Transcript_53011/m.125186 type:complete len:203 (+) Transcript_53011:323-931(+)